MRRASQRKEEKRRERKREREMRGLEDQIGGKSSEVREGALEYEREIPGMNRRSPINSI